VSIRRRGAGTLKLQHQRNPVFAHRSHRLATVADDVDDSIIHLWDLFAPNATLPQSVAKREAASPKKKIQLGKRTVHLEATFASGRFEGVTSPDGQMAAAVTGHYGETLQLWRLDGAAPVRVVEFDVGQLASADFSEALQSLSFSPDSQVLASGGSDGTVKLWNRQGKLLLGRPLMAHTQGTNARFSPDGRLLLTWGDSRDGEVAVKLWTIDGELLDSLSQERVRNAWFSEDGRWILATDENGRTKVWNLDLDALLRQGCTQLELYLASPTVAQDRGTCG